METSDQSTIEKVLAGDVEAYSEIVGRYQTDILKTVAYALLDHQTSEDLVQQTFVNAYLNLSKFDLNRDFGVWLRSIARNLVRSELRKTGRESNRLRHYHNWLSAQYDNAEQAREQAKILEHHLEQCRMQLSEPDAEVLDMRYGKDMGFAQIAEALGRTVAATRQMLSRIRIALRQCTEKRRSEA